MQDLYPGETLDTIAGYPTIYHYEPSGQQETKALIVCVPGSMHLGRIFYGGHVGSVSSDFLSHWLSTHGFGVLCLSYPVESNPPVMPHTGAAFRIGDWARQAAMTAKEVMSKHNLTTAPVILISWSMGGRMVVPFTTAARELGLDVQQFISFAATPGFSMTRPSTGLISTKSGYLDIPSSSDVFYHQLAEMHRLNQGRMVIPHDVYEREYVGATPVGLTALEMKYAGSGSGDDTDFVEHETSSEEETRVLDVAEYPFITAVYPTSILDARHALADRASWGFLLTRKIESAIAKNGLDAASSWDELLDLVHSAPSRLCLPVEGNHFFFVGERTARNAAETVAELVGRAQKFKSSCPAAVDDAA